MTESVMGVNMTSNTVTESTVGIRRNEIGWILSQAAASVFTLASMYLTFAALYCRFKHWKSKKMFKRNYVVLDQRISTISGFTVGNNNNDLKARVRWRPSSASNDHRPRKGTTALEVLVIIAAVSVTLRMFSEQQVLNLSDRSKADCNRISTIHVVLYAMPIAPIYSFLWVRQRILYSRPLIRRLFDSNKCRSLIIRAISMTIILVMVIGELVIALVFTLTITYKPGELGCETDTTLLPEWGPWLMIILFTGTFQVLLLGLYIWPMISMRNQKMRNNDPESGGARVHGPELAGTTIKRACAATFLCVASDAIAGLVTLTTKVVPVASNLVYDLNLIVNLIAITLTFSDWRNRLFPFCCYQTLDLPQSVKSASGQTISNGSGQSPERPAYGA